MKASLLEMVLAIAISGIIFALVIAPTMQTMAASVAWAATYVMMAARQCSLWKAAAVFQGSWPTTVTRPFLGSWTSVAAYARSHAARPPQQQQRILAR